VSNYLYNCQAVDRCFEESLLKLYPPVSSHSPHVESNTAASKTTPSFLFKSIQQITHSHSHAHSLSLSVIFLVVISRQDPRPQRRSPGTQQRRRFANRIQTGLGGKEGGDTAQRSQGLGLTKQIPRVKVIVVHSHLMLSQC
jgi:hypothetical protein